MATKQYWQGYLTSKGEICNTESGVVIKVSSPDDDHLKMMQQCFGVTGTIHKRQPRKYVLELSATSDVLPVLQSLHDMSQQLPPVPGVAEALKALRPNSYTA